MRRFPGAALVALALAAAVACEGDGPSTTAPPAPQAEEPAAGDFVAPRYAEVVGGSGANLAFTEEAPTVDPRLTAHSRKMAQRIYRSAGNVYCAVGYGLANMTVIEGDDGLVVVDVLESVENARSVMAEIRKLTAKPVRAVVYTHNHYDHVMGAEGVVTREDVAAGRVAVYAHAKLMQGLLNQLSVVGEAIAVRSLYTFGGFLDRGAEGSVNEGIGPLLVSGPTGFIPPTHTFDDALELSIAGLRLELLHAPSETDDEIVVWLPDRRVLQSAEVIQGETFPNLYTIRGTTYRDPVAWYRTVDRLRALRPAHLVPSHGRPVEGEDAIASLLTAYRDAIQFTHDQTVRLINQGLTPDEIAARLPALPPHLAAHPWVGEFYGTVEHSVRNVYGGYLGWFQGDPTTLDPLPPRERARRYVERMGGRDAVVRAAREAHERGDHQWCAELLTWAIRVDPDDREARALKADALRRLAYGQTSINWRNFQLTAAKELDGTLDASRYDLSRGAEILGRLPLVNVLENLATRIDADRTRDVRRTLALRATDTKRDYGLEIRRGVVEVHRALPPHADVTVSGEEEVLRDVLLQRRNALKELVVQGIAVEGGVGALADFFAPFDRPSPTPAALVVR
jgi:alkyl sulfatase BDS1-like metallo-beta-lactamase superfamily hydrolase